MVHEWKGASSERDTWMQRMASPSNTLILDNVYINSYRKSLHTLHVVYNVCTTYYVAWDLKERGTSDCLEM